jgi:hypothetical protein
MTFKVMTTVAAVAVAAAANCGCSAVPPALQAQGAYGSVGGPYAATSPIVQIPGERVVGADPDVNVRYELNRDAGFHLHGGSSN